MSSKDRPVRDFKLGRIRASIWANQTDGKGDWYSVTISRVYRDGDAWQEATSFSRDDLPLVAKAAELAYAWIWETSSREQGVHGQS